METRARTLYISVEGGGKELDERNVQKAKRMTGLETRWGPLRNMEIFLGFVKLVLLFKYL